ncbi:MAG: ABC transporter permease, partial [Gemmatimonadota bacterium]
KDLRYTLRGLLRAPVLLITAAISIALGAVGNIAVFSLAREILFITPHARDPETLVKMRVSHGSHASFQRWKDLDASGAVQRIAGYSFEEPANWFNGDAAISITPMVVTANFFDVVGVPVSLGRTFNEAEARAELEPRLAVLTHSFWQSNLSADSSIVGKSLLLDGEAYTVTGVLVPGLRSIAGFALSPGVYISLNRSNMPDIVDPERHVLRSSDG